MNTSEKYHGGISRDRIKGPIDPELLCGLCHQVLFRPQVCSKCEAPFCGPCLEEWKRLNPTLTATCPNGCVAQYTQPSKVLKNFLNRLKIKCRYVKSGCHRELSYEELEEHERRCDYPEGSCSGCGKKMLIAELNEHQAICDMVLTACPKCGKELIRADLIRSHDVSDCFCYKFEKLEEAFGKRITALEEENKNLKEKMEKGFEENKSSQNKIVADLLEKIRVLEEQNKKPEKKVEEVTQDKQGKEKPVEEEKKKEESGKKEEPAKKEDEHLEEAAGNVFGISSSPQNIYISPGNVQQKFTMDSYLGIKKDKGKIWHINSMGPWNTIKCYEDFDALEAGFCSEKKLGATGYGTYWTIFQGFLFFIVEDKDDPKIGKLNLSIGILERTKILEDAVGYNKTQGGYNDIIFISNTKSLYIVYESKETNKIVIGLVDAESLRVIKTWKTNSQPKKKYGSIFMINDVLFATASHSDQPTKIIFKFDTETCKEENTDISFANFGGYDTSLHFCYPAKQLWTVNNGKLYIYDVKGLEDKESK